MIDLIITPHPDDDVYALGGYLASKDTKDTHILCCCDPGQDRTVEHSNALGILGVSLNNVEYLVEEDNYISLSYPIVVDYINQWIVDKSGDECNLYIPLPSYNQDHRAVYDACLTALRPHKRFKGGVYTYPSPGNYMPGDYSLPSSGHTYLPLESKHVYAKINALEQFRSQLLDKERTVFDPKKQWSICEWNGGISHNDYAEVVYHHRTML